MMSLLRTQPGSHLPTFASASGPAPHQQRLQGSLTRNHAQFAVMTFFKLLGSFILSV